MWTKNATTATFRLFLLN